jgi:hypothetical protein
LKLIRRADKRGFRISVNLNVNLVLKGNRADVEGPTGVLYIPNIEAGWREVGLSIRCWPPLLGPSRSTDTDTDVHPSPSLGRLHKNEANAVGVFSYSHRNIWRWSQATGPRPPATTKKIHAWVRGRA